MEVVTPAQWILTFAMFAIILGLEVCQAIRHPHQPSIMSSAIWSIISIVAALIYALVIYAIWDRQLAVEYVTGYVTERALSIDNLFVFIIIMSSFAVPKNLQQLVMLCGVAIAIVLRGIFIGIGAAIIEQFSWVFYIFGFFLIVTAWRMLGSNEPQEDEEYTENAFIRAVRRVVPVSDSWEGHKLWLRKNGVWMITPMMLVMLAIGSTDLLFAFDSIPAIFGITDEPYIVFTANAWALMGMVQLYFLLGGLVERLVYLSYGLAFILALIGLKLIIHAMHENSLPFLNGGDPITVIPEISTVASLVLILVALVVASIFSLRKTAAEEKSRPGTHDA